MTPISLSGTVRRATIVLASAGLAASMLAGAGAVLAIVATSTTAVAVSDLTIDLGATVDLTATVTGSESTRPELDGLVPAPSGTVSFFYCYNASIGIPNCPESARVAIGAPVVLTPGVGTASTATISPWTPAAGRGWYTFAAVYAGDDTYTASQDAGTAEITHLYVHDPNALPSEVTVSDHAPGRGQTVRVCVLHLPEGGSARIGVEAWGIDREVPAGRDGAACLDITVPANAQPASYPVTFSYADANAQPLFVTETLIVMLPASDAAAVAGAGAITVQDDSRSPWTLFAILVAAVGTVAWTRRTARRTR